MGAAWRNLVRSPVVLEVPPLLSSEAKPFMKYSLPCRFQHPHCTEFALKWFENGISDLITCLATLCTACILYFDITFVMMFSFEIRFLI